MSILFKRKYPVVEQHDQSDCAAAVLATICKFYKKDFTIMKMREIIGTDIYGTTVHGMIHGIEKIGFLAKAIKINIDDVAGDYTLPAVAQVITERGENHFVVIHKIKNKRFIIADPAKGLIEYSERELQKIFTGILIVLIPKNEFEVEYVKQASMWVLFKQVMLPQKNILGMVILCSFVLTVIGIVSGLFSKIVFDEIIPYHLEKALYRYMIVFGIVGIIQVFLSSFRSYILLFISRKIDIPVLLGYYNHILRLPFTFFTTRRVGEILTRFQDAMAIKEIFSQVAVTLVLDVFLATFTGIALFRLNPSLFAITAVVVGLNIILIYLFKGRYKSLNYEQMEANSIMNSHLIESVKNIEIIKASTSESSQLEKLEHKFVKVQKLEYKEGILGIIQGMLSSSIGNISSILLIGFGAISIIRGDFSIGDLLIFQTLSGYFIEPIQNLVSLQLTYQEAQIAMKRLAELMDLDLEEQSNEESLQDTSIDGNIHFDNITFKYGSRPPILNNLTLTIKQGSRVAIVGESGAGKTTIAKLLMRFYSLESGKISLNGYNVEDIQIMNLRKKIGYVPQKVEFFTGTILENIKCSDEMATYEQVVAASKLAGCYNFIQKLPNRFHSFIEEDGTNLSGGEKQMIAIARAFLRERELYIFDESTSNLDSFSENYIQKVMLRATNGKTTIIIAHRLSTIINSDWIIFMKNGNIVEQGTHETLMNVGGKYSEMIELQRGYSVGTNKKDTIISPQEEIRYD